MKPSFLPVKIVLVLENSAAMFFPDMSPTPSITRLGLANRTLKGLKED
jgi:hypothetical protein